MEQRSVLDEIISNPGCHLVTGSAGTGKSSLLRSLIHHLKLDDDYEPIVLAPTGIAAVNVHGITIHRFFGATVTKSTD
ncbi:hypothetical protein BGX20_007681, partial [Mortierella sp. AD010]